MRDTVMQIDAVYRSALPRLKVMAYKKNNAGQFRPIQVVLGGFASSLKELGWMDAEARKRLVYRARGVLRRLKHRGRV